MWVSKHYDTDEVRIGADFWGAMGATAPNKWAQSARRTRKSRPAVFCYRHGVYSKLLSPINKVF